MTLFHRRSRTSFIAVICLLGGAAVAASRFAPSDQAQAARIAARRVPITFGTPRDYAAATDYLKKLAAANPDLTDLVEIGKSAGGRPIYVLVVSNMKTGVTMDRLVPLQHPRAPSVANVPPMKVYQARPATWIDGGTHGLDRDGAEACLYIADRLLASYGSDAEVTHLVDATAFYICPSIDVDGFAAAAGGKAPAVEAIARNFPEGWWKDDNTPGGSGTYPSSLPEARAVLEFFTTHTNILLVQSFDSAGGFGVRPYARWPAGRVDARDVAVFDGVIGKKWQEMAGALAGSWKWRAAYDAARQAPAGYGVFHDWAYGQFGAYATATDLSLGRGSAGTAEKLYELAWQMERYKATQLPRLQFKDASARVLYTTNNATKARVNETTDTIAVKRVGAGGRYKVVQIVATVENVGALPTHVAQGAQLRGNRQDVVWLLGDRAKVTFLQGTRWMPIGVLQGTLPLPRATAAEGARAGRAGGGGGGRGRGGLAAQMPLTDMREQRPAAGGGRAETGSSRTVSWLVAVDGDTPLRVALTSQKGGTIVRDLVIQ